MATSGVISAIHKSSPRSLYLHQNEAITALDKLDKLGSYSTLLVLPTGADKTYTTSTWLLTHALNKGKKKSSGWRIGICSLTRRRNPSKTLPILTLFRTRALFTVE